MSTMWCYFCNVAAIELVLMDAEYSDIDLEILTLLFENTNQEQPNITDLQAWANQFGTSDNILSADRFILANESKFKID